MCLYLVEMGFFLECLFLTCFQQVRYALMWFFLKSCLLFTGFLNIKIIILIQFGQCFPLRVTVKRHPSGTLHRAHFLQLLVVLFPRDNVLFFIPFLHVSPWGVVLLGPQPCWLCWWYCYVVEPNLKLSFSVNFLVQIFCFGSNIPFVFPFTIWLSPHFPRNFSTYSWYSFKVLPC